MQDGREGRPWFYSFLFAKARPCVPPRGGDIDDHIKTAEPREFGAVTRLRA